MSLQVVKACWKQPIGRAYELGERLLHDPDKARLFLFRDDRQRHFWRLDQKRISMPSGNY